MNGSGSGSPSTTDDAKAPRRVLLIHTHPFPQSVATLWHLAQELVAQGAIVDAYDAFAVMASRMPEIRFHDRLLEAMISKYRRFVLPAINGTDLSKRVSTTTVEVPPLPATVPELRLATTLGARTGLAALSSAATFTEIAVRDRTAEYGPSLEVAWRVAHQAAAIADRLRLGHDDVYVYNGRTADTRPFCDILEREARVFRYDAGGAPDSYFAYPGAIHDAGNIADIMSDHAVDTAAGVSFFEMQRGRKPGTAAHLFTAQQTVGLLPQALAGDDIIAMFTSSEDEFFAINDVAAFGAFETQYDVALAVASLCRQHGKTLVLRLHPHLAIKKDYWRRDWDFDRLREFGVTIIMPEELVDSYALLDRAELIVTCGSTIGLEAAYHGKPSLMIGDYLATALGVCTAAHNTYEIEQFIEHPQVSPDARDNAIIIASYRRSGGTIIPGLVGSAQPDRARLNGKLMDPARHIAKRLQKTLGI